MLSPSIARTTVFPACVILLLLIALGASNSGGLATLVSQSHYHLTSSLSSFFIWSTHLFLCCSLVIILLPFSKKRLGSTAPSLPFWSWFSLMLGAGIGIGLIFFSVSEPVMHYEHPILYAPTDQDKSLQALRFTYLHWGLHAWAIYALMGLGFAISHYIYQKPMQPRHLFYPLLKRQLPDFLAASLDILVIVASVLSLGTTLGIGSQQLNHALSFAFDMPYTYSYQVCLILIIAIFSSVSMKFGFQKGMRRCSQISLLLSVALMLFVASYSHPAAIASQFCSQLSDYLIHVLPLGHWVAEGSAAQWQGDWTIFYYAWWAAWAPLVGMFIARVSRGRTIREFLCGVLVAPTAFIALWFAIFGNSAIDLIQHGNHSLPAQIESDITYGIFALLTVLPHTALSISVTFILVILFFVTSYDAGTSTLTDICVKPTKAPLSAPPYSLRLFWLVLSSAAAIVLLKAGGLQIIQTLSVLTGAPFILCIWLVILGVLRAAVLDASPAKLAGHSPKP